MLTIWYYFADLRSDALNGDRKVLKSVGEANKGDRKAVMDDEKAYKMWLGSAEGPWSGAEGKDKEGDS